MPVSSALSLRDLHLATRRVCRGRANLHLVSSSVGIIHLLFLLLRNIVCRPREALMRLRQRLLSLREALARFRDRLFRVRELF